MAPEAFCGKPAGMKRPASPAEPPVSRLGFEHALAVLAGLTLAACDKAPPQAAPEPVATEVEPSTKAAVPERAEEAEKTAPEPAPPAVEPPAVGAKEVRASAPSSAPPPKDKAPAAKASGGEGACAPGGCAPGKCGGAKQ